MRAQHWLLRELLGLLDLLLPEVCPLCRSDRPAWPGGWCRSCRRQILPLPPSHCPICALPYPAAAGSRHRCGACLKNPPAFDAVLPLGLYEGVLREAVHQLKFTRQPFLDRSLGLLLQRRLRRHGWLEDQPLIVPIPLHPSRLRQRTFNQSLLLARQISRDCRPSLRSGLVVRLRPTPHQQGLSAAARSQNLRGAFGVNGQLQGEPVLLVDDVLTTGATLNEAARALRRAGAGEVRAAVLARAPRHLTGNSLHPAR